MTYRATVLADSPTSYWRLGDSGSTVVDEQSAHAGSYSGNSTQQVTGLLSGDADKALLVGTTNATSVPNSSAFDPTHSFTIECWIKTPASLPSSGIKSFVSNADIVHNGFVLEWVPGAGQLSLRFGNNGGDGLAVASWSPSVSTIYHLVGWYDNSNNTCDIYINANAQNTGGTATGTATSQALYLGADPQGNHCDGFVLDEVAYYPAVLTSTQVETHYSVGAGVNILHKSGIGIAPFTGGGFAKTNAVTGKAVSEFTGGGMRYQPALPDAFPAARIHLPASTTTGQVREAQGVMDRLADVGTTDYYHMQVYFPSPWVDASAEGVTIMQPNWQDLTDDHPAIQLRARATYVEVALHTGEVTLDTSGNPVYTYDSGSPGPNPRAITGGNFVTNVWHELVLGITWATDTTGVVQVWHRLSGATAWTQTVNLTGVPTFQWGTLVTGHTWNPDGTDQGGNNRVTYDKAGGYALYGTNDVVLYHATVSRHASFALATGERSGAGISDFDGAGHRNWVKNETGVAIAPFTGGAPKARTDVDTGTGVIDNMTGKGSKAMTRGKFGSGIAPFTGGGPSVFTKSKAGAGVAPFTGGGTKSVLNMDTLLDNFNRANENPLSGGGNWSTSGTFHAPFQVFSNQAIATSGAKINESSYTAAGDLTDCRVAATIVTLPGTGNYIGVTARQDPALDTGKNFYEVVYMPGTGVLVDYYDSAGTTHTLATYSGATFSAGDKIGLSVIGTTLTAWQKTGGTWSVLGSVTDSNLSHGYIGVTGFPVASGGALDDFSGG